MGPELWFDKRALRFVNMGINNKNAKVKAVARMGARGSYSIFGSNFRSLEYKYHLSFNDISKK